MTNTMTYEVPVANVGAIVHQTDALRKRAARVGVTFTAPVISEARFCRLDKTRDRVNVWTEVTFEVDTAPIRFEGWRLAGVVEAMGDEAIIREVPGETVAAEYAAHPYRCEHCDTDRTRRETFVIQHEDGRAMQVGRQCLADFLGGQTVEAIVAFARYLRDLSDAAETDGDDWPHVERGAGAVEVIAEAVKVIRMDGTYRKADSDRSTRGTVGVMFFPARGGAAAERDARTRAEYGETTEADYAQAQAIVEWASGLTHEADGSYLGNVGALVRAGWVPVSKWGTLVSAPAAYDRATQAAEREATRAVERALAGPVPTGKVEIEGVIVSMADRVTDFGTVTKITVKGDAGWRVWASLPAALADSWDDDGEQVDGARVGDRVAFVVTVKAADNDDTMGFGSRPSKARIVARGEGA
jgi:hypothetical protein